MTTRGVKSSRGGKGGPSRSSDHPSTPKRAGAPSQPGSLHERWGRLHLTDREPWPDRQLIEKLARQHPDFASWVQQRHGSTTVATALQRAWAQFHDGSFREAIAAGERLGALGATVANKAAAVHSLYAKRGADEELKLLEAAAQRGDSAVAVLPDYANAHYTLALVLGRYSQGISILKALAAGIAGRVRTHLERTLELEPGHAEAHVAFGLYHAEIVAKLGALAAGLTYGASKDAALTHFRKATQLAPASAIICIEHANGLLLLDPDRYRQEARALYARAAEVEPVDEMERLDVERARRGLD